MGCQRQGVAQVKAQLPKGHIPFDEPINVRVEYWAGDKRRRDMPAIHDALFHVCEKAGVVADDTHIWVASSTRGYDKKFPRALMIFGV
jgi:Holliday junction resolvase RusA-like endonuclease